MKIKIINAETDEVIEGVTAIQWNIGLDGLGTAIIRVHNVFAEIKLEDSKYVILEELDK